jgi:DNA-binding NtrC family response regulator
VKQDGKGTRRSEERGAREGDAGAEALHLAREAERDRDAAVLILEGDAVLARSLAACCAREGLTPVVASDREEALALLARADEVRPFDVLLCEGDGGGMELVKKVARAHRATATIVVTAYGTVESAVDALRAGACDYLVKPIVDAELRLSLQRALRQAALQRESHALKGRLDNRRPIANVIGGDPRIAKVFDVVRAVAPSKTTVLMTGESGTGKSLIARAIHDQSPRKDRAFVEISCGSIPESLLESELFGHVKGAFTGAHADKAGRFLAANQGTLFLDEINSASAGMQLKLLRVLQEKRFEPVGSSQTVEVDVRVILATNQPLEALVAAGQFRQDLYYRINVISIQLPPLRERREDVAQLAEHFLAKHAGELRRQLVGFTPEAMAALKAYAFPGNVRELQNIIERAAVLAQGQVVEVGDLPDQVARAGAAVAGDRLGIGGAGADASGRLIAQGVSQGAARSVTRAMTLEDAMREPERQIIQQALEANAWNRQKTSEQLGINRTTLYKKMRALGMLSGEEDRPAA